MTYKAFVSSTFEDLKAHRAHVIAALRRAGIFVDPMEDWTAAADEPKKFSQDRVKDCDLCVLLVAFRRGHVPEGETLSITQLEHQAAVELGIDVLVFILEEQAPWPRKFDELDKEPEIRRWRATLIEHKGIGFFYHEASSIDIAPALTRWIGKKNQRESKLQSLTELEQNKDWLGAQLQRAEIAFQAQLSGGEDVSAPPKSRQYIELLIKNRGASEAQERPFSELLETPGTRCVIFGDGGSGKSTSLLKVAIDAYHRAIENPEAPIPLFAQLNFFDTKARGIDRLMEIIGEAVGIDPAKVRRLWRESKRPLLFLMDGFNEVAPEFQEACILALGELVQVGRHGFLITSRPVASIEALINDRSGVQASQIVELKEHQIRDFLTRHQAAELYDRMEDDLKKLSENPFMLWALTQSCKDLTPGELPRNKGQLYTNFIEYYIFEKREKKKLPPPTRYNYALVKKPILARLAHEMTRRGVTRHPVNMATYEQLRDHLQEIRMRSEGLVEIKAYELMPDPPTAKNLLDEIVHNGVLRRSGETLEFMHQSIRDCFAAMALLDLPLSSVLAEVPEARWIRSSDNAITNEHRTQLYDSLVMFSGLSSRSDDLVTGLIENEPVLASECLASAQHVSEPTRVLLLSKLLALLRSDDETNRYVGCTCVHKSRIHTPELVDAIERMLLSNEEWLGCRIAAASALGRLDSDRVIPILFELLRAPIEQEFAILRFIAMATIQFRANPQRDLSGILLLLMGEDQVLSEVSRLYQTHSTKEELVQSLISSQDWMPSYVLLKLIHERAAAELLTKIIRNSEPLYVKAFSFLPLMSCSESVTATLLAILDDAKRSQLDKVLAAFGVADLALQQGSPINLVRSLSAAAELRNSLRQRMTDRRLPVAIRVAAALGIARASENTDLEIVVKKIKDPSEDQEFRATFCQYANLMIRSYPFFLSLIIQSKVSHTWVVDVLVERALQDESKDVRLGAALD